MSRGDPNLRKIPPGRMRNRSGGSESVYYVVDTASGLVVDSTRDNPREMERRIVKSGQRSELLSSQGDEFHGG